MTKLILGLTMWRMKMVVSTDAIGDLYINLPHHMLRDILLIGVMILPQCNPGDHGGL